MRTVYALIDGTEGDVVCIYSTRPEAEHMFDVNLKDSGNHLRIEMTTLAEDGDVVLPKVPPQTAVKK